MIASTRTFVRALQLGCLAACAATSSFLHAQWFPAHPGAGGQVQAVTLDPVVSGRAYLLSDVEGLYRTDDGGASYKYIGYDVHCGAAYALAVDPVLSNRIYLGTQRGVLISDNAGATWSPVAATTSHTAQNGHQTGLPVATITVNPANNQHVYFANSWLIKHSLAVWTEMGQNGGTTSANTDTYHPGVLWYSRDRGQTWQTTTFDSATGQYMNVYTIQVDPTNSNVVYVGAHQGIYRGTFNGSTWSWSKLAAPAGTYRGRGCAITPDGNWIIAAYTTGGADYYIEGQNKDGSPPHGAGPIGLTCYVSRTSTISWTTLSTGLPTDANSGGDRHTIHFWKPLVDPIGYSTSNARVIMGTLGGATGLYEARFNLPSSGAPSLASNWTRILWQAGSSGFQYDQGWDTYTATCRVYGLVPAAWTPGASRSEIWSSTNQTMFASNTSAAGWPTSAASWTERYSEPMGTVSGDGTTYKVYTTRGWQSTITLDVDFHENYAVQCMRDNGFAESWDGGVTWTRFHRVNSWTNALAAHIVKDRSPAVAMVGAGTGFYASTDSQVRLMPLTTLTAEDDWISPTNQPTGTVRGLATVTQGTNHRVLATTSNGLYEHSSLNNLLTSTGTWTQLRTASTKAVTVGTIGGTGGAAIYNASSTGIEKGTWNGSGWTWSGVASGSKSDVAAWRNGSTTWLAYTTDGSGVGPNPTDATLVLTGNDGANTTTVMTTTQLLASYQPAFWNYLYHQKRLRFTVTGEGNQIFLFAGAQFSRVGIAVLRGTIGGTASAPTVTWQDWRGSGFTAHEFPVVNRAKIAEIDGVAHVVTATNGAGAWCRPLVSSAPVASIVANDASAGEPANNGQFTVTLAPAPSSTVSVNLSRTGTATNGTDYTSIPTTVNVGTSGTATINVTVTDDALYEGNETVILTLASGTGYTVGSPSAATVTIADNESQPVVTVTASDASAGEPSNHGQFTVTASPAPQNAISVNLATSGTATSGADYTALPSSVTVSSTGSTTVAVTVIDDSVVESNETVILTAQSGTGYTVGTPASGTVTITDNDSAPTTVTFTSIAAEDGYINESTETSSVGGSAFATDTGGAALRLGDNAQNKQIVLVVSFDTASLPDGATITGAVLRLKRGGGSGTNPFTTHGNAQVAIIGGSGFGGSAALAASDFEAAAGANNVGTMSNPAAVNDWSSATLSSGAYSQVNKTGKTQLRVAFTLDDNNDLVANYIGFYAGEAASGDRPQLEITYTP